MMFTLKLYRRRNDQLVTRIAAVHHVTVMEIGVRKRTLELWAHVDAQGGDYEAFFIGEKEEGMDALNDDNHFGWGLLENGEGKTTQHFRPAGCG